MFKKVNRGKLSLSRETVRDLQSVELNRAAGGVLKVSVLGMCSFTDPGPDTQGGDHEQPCPTATIYGCTEVSVDWCPEA